MTDYRYMLIRYVPDRERMEPSNVGVILQSPDKIDLRFSEHAAKRNDIDTATYNEWKRFLRTEITGEAAPLFQPDRNSQDFLRHLETLCGGTVLLSRPLLLSADPARSFDNVLNSLFDRLVALPKSPPPGEAHRPTGRFRQLAEEGRFLSRGMKKHAHLAVENIRTWIAYRQVLNGELLAMDKVEIASHIGQTCNEIERLPLIAERLPQFLGARVEGKATQYVLLADELSEPFTDQSPEEFRAMRDDLEQYIDVVRKVHGVRIIREAGEAATFASEIDGKLPSA